MGLPVGKIIGVVSNLFKGRVVKSAVAVAVGGGAAVLGAEPIGAQFDIGPNIVEALKQLALLVSSIAAVVAAVAGILNQRSASA